MAGVRKSKAKKMQAAASEANTRTRKGRNKSPKVSRADSKKTSTPAGKRQKKSGEPS